MSEYEIALEDRIHNLYAKISDLQQENKQLKEKIDKAIEYIKKNSYGWGTKYYDDDFNANELLEILGDKE